MVRVSPIAALTAPFLATLVVIGACLGFGVGIGASPSAAAENSLTLGVVPQQSKSRLVQVWVPLTQYLSEQLGVPVGFATAKDIPTFEACLAKGAYDIAYMNPYHYVVFHDAPGYEAIVRQKGKMLQGLMVTRKDRPKSGLMDLQNAKLAFPSPAAFGASVLPQAEMRKLGLTFKADYVKSHDSVYRAVALGLHDAGGGVRRTWEILSPDVREQLEIFYETAPYTPHPIAVHPNLPGKLRAALQTALVALSAEDGTILADLGIQGFEEGRNADWDDVRSLHLDKSQTQIVDKSSRQCRFGSN